MRPNGLSAIESAKADGRWAAAYEPQSRASVPEDLKNALASNKAARAFFDALDGRNRYAILYRINDAKKPETRMKRIAAYVQLRPRRDPPSPTSARLPSRHADRPTTRSTAAMSSSSLNGFSSVRCGISARKVCIFGVNAPPVMKTMLRTASGARSMHAA